MNVTESGKVNDLVRWVLDEHDEAPAEVVDAAAYLVHRANSTLAAGLRESEVRSRLRIVCGTCGGCGTAPQLVSASGKLHWATCPDCGGTGQVQP